MTANHMLLWTLFPPFQSYLLYPVPSLPLKVSFPDLPLASKFQITYFMEYTAPEQLSHDETSTSFLSLPYKRNGKRPGVVIPFR